MSLLSLGITAAYDFRLSFVDVLSKSQIPDEWVKTSATSPHALIQEIFNNR